MRRALIRAHGIGLRVPSRGVVAPTDAAECRALNEELLKTPPALASAAVVSTALKAFGKDIAIAFSGAEDVYVIELAARSGLPYRVFSLDTGRLHKETYEYFAAVEKHYGFRIEYCVPPQAELQALVRAKGQFSFYTDGHAECCTIRKVLPLRQQLSTLRAWMTGLRADQSPSTRSTLPYCEIDPAFPGVGGAALVKFNPLANETSSSVWAALRANNVPVNELHSQGYISVGCQPCTRPVLPNAHEREGRWWWEDAEGKECGLHKKK